MSWQERVRPLVPFAAGALVVPVLWAVVIVALPDDRLATTAGALIVRGELGERTERFSEAEAAYNVTVLAVGSGGADPPRLEDGSDDPNGTGTGTGRTGPPRIQVLVASFATGADTALDAQGPVWMALVSAQKHDLDTGNTTFDGWRLTDARDGQLWAGQSSMLTGVRGFLLPMLVAGVFVAYGLGRPLLRRPPLPAIDLPPAVAGLGMGVLMAFLFATADGSSNVVYPGDADGIPVPGALAYGLAAAGLVGALWKRPRMPPSGSRTAIVGGVALLISLPVALVMLWDDPVRASFALHDESTFATIVGSLTAVVLLACRLLTVRWARWAAALFLVTPALYFAAATEGLFAGLALPIGVLLVAGARDLVEPVE